MKRLTEINRYWEEDEFWYDAREPDVEDIDKIYNRLAAIEDILGDEYDLDKLRELVEADREERCDEPKRMTVDDVKLMVAATKKTTSWDGKTAYDVPVGEGKCVESFPRAVRLWCDFLGVKFKWR